MFLPSKLDRIADTVDLIIRRSDGTSPPITKTKHKQPFDNQPACGFGTSRRAVIWNATWNATSTYNNLENITRRKSHIKNASLKSYACVANTY